MENAQIERKLEQILEKLGFLEQKVKELEEKSVRQSKIQGEIEEEFKAVKSVRNRALENMSDGEKRIFDHIQRLSQDNEVTLRRLKEETGLDYKTVAGYTNRLVRYGLVERNWDGSRKVNLYKIPEDIC